MARDPLTTAAGVAIAVGGIIRDMVVARSEDAAQNPAAAYVPVFALEALLLGLAVFVAMALRNRERQARRGGAGPDEAPEDVAPRPVRA